MFSGGETPKINPAPRDLRLPQDMVVEQETPYTVPAEFWAARENSFRNLDTEPNFIPFARGDSFLGTAAATARRSVKTVLSLGGLSNTSRNLLAAVQHPWDYGRGHYERRLAESPAPQEYTLMDGEYAAAQEIGTYATIGLSAYVLAYAGSKNMDGAGRISMLWDPKEKGIYRFGSLPATLFTKFPIYLMGGSLAAQHRFLQGHDGMPSAQAYFTALNPIEGWALTLHDADHNFRDYVYADFVASAVMEFVGQYFWRVGNIGAVASYAAIFPQDLIPALEEYVATRLEDLERARLKYLELSARLEKLQGGVVQKVQPGGDSSRVRVVQKLSGNRREVQTLEGDLIRLEGDIKGMERWETQVQERLGRPLATEVRGRKGKRVVHTRLQDVEEALKQVQDKIDQLRGEAETPANGGRRLQRIGRQIHIYNQQKEMLLASRKDLLTKKRALRRGKPIQQVYFSRKDVRRMVRAALGEIRERFWAPGRAPHLDTLEGARNIRMRMTPEELAVRHTKGKAARFAYGMQRMLANGRWRVLVPRYLAGGVVGWGEGVVLYHYMWDMPWDQAMASALSVFVTTPPNQFWVQGLKTTGVERVPGVVEFIPSAAMVNGWWSVTRWDRTIMLQRCKAKASELLHSQDPEYRAGIRAEIAELWAMANEREKKDWSKPRSEGGCGLPPPE